MHFCRPLLEEVLLLDLNVGVQVFFRLSDVTRYSATIISANDNTIVIRANEEIPSNITKGGQLVIAASETDFYTEVISRDDSMMSLKRLWSDRRGYFRVDDVFPVACKKVMAETSIKKSKMISGYADQSVDLTMPEEFVHPQLWKMLHDINAKLNLVLERLNLQGEGFLQAEDRKVNLSATGLKVTTDEKADMGDNVEIKMLLPTYPPTGILAHGRVVRVEDKGNGEYELSLHFVDMDETIRDEIIQYALNRQREIIRTQRQQE